MTGEQLKINHKYILAYLTSAILFILLFINYTYNSFGIVADTTWFTDWQLDSEQLVLDRIINFDQFGFRYNSALLGKDGYLSQIGIQGTFFGILFILSNSYSFLHVFTTLIFCLTVFYILNWVIKEFGLFPSILTYVFLFFNQWLIVSSRNLYWVTSTFLFPFIISLYFLRKEEKTKILKSHLWVISIFISIFIRSGCGYEFITVAMINSILPIFYYAFKNKWKNDIFYKRLILIGIVSGLSFFFTIFVHLIQLSLFTNDCISNSIKILIYRIGDRTGAFTKTNEASIVLVRESLEAMKLRVIHFYFFDGRPLLFGMNMGILFPIFLCVGMLSFASEKIINGIDVIQSKLISLFVVTIISMIGPLSWFTLASGHSYIHRTINYILWSLPTLILMGVQIGCIIELLIKNILLRKPLLLIYLAFLILSLFSFIYIDITANGLRYLNYVEEDGIELISNEYISIYNYENRLYFIADNIDLSRQFFLHFYKVSESNGEYEFINNDFKFSYIEMKTPFWNPKKIAVMDFPKDRIEFFEIGQYEGNIRYWSSRVNLDKDAKYEN